jgi:hypothetical protein
MDDDGSLAAVFFSVFYLPRPGGFPSAGAIAYRISIIVAFKK